MKRYAVPMTREEIEKRMDERARKYTETHDIEELYQLAAELEKMKKLEKQ